MAESLGAKDPRGCRPRCRVLSVNLHYRFDFCLHFLSSFYASFALVTFFFFVRFLFLIFLFSFCLRQRRLINASTRLRSSIKLCRPHLSRKRGRERAWLIERTIYMVDYIYVSICRELFRNSRVCRNFQDRYDRKCKNLRNVIYRN